MMLVKATTDKGPHGNPIADCEWPHGDGTTRALVPVNELVSITRV
jgi:hypothetical protein